MFVGNPHRGQETFDAQLRELYRSNFRMEIAGDIREINQAEIPAHDILCAGFPCQPFSKSARLTEGHHTDPPQERPRRPPDGAASQHIRHGIHDPEDTHFPSEVFADHLQQFLAGHFHGRGFCQHEGRCREGRLLLLHTTAFGQVTEHQDGTPTFQDLDDVKLITTHDWGQLRKDLAEMPPPPRGRGS